MEDIKNFKIVYSKRRTVSLEVTIKGDLIVRAPFSMAYDEILRIILKHERWIRNKLSYMKNLPYVPEKRFVEGECFWYLGNTYKLNIVSKQKESLTFSNNRFYLRNDVINKARDVFINWYKKETLSIVREKTNFYAAKCHLSFKSLRVTSAKRRWGSCSGGNSINFSYRVIMAPIFVIGYVVVHELCHILEHNHSKNFWSLVENVMPDYEIAKKWLKYNGYMLHI